MVGVSVTIGRTVLQPGGSMEVPDHLVAELQPAFRQGLLSTKQPEPLPPAPKPASPVVVAKTEPTPATVVETPTEAPPETPEPDNTEQRRRRR